MDYDLKMPYPAAAESWRQTHLGRLLEMAGQRFEDFEFAGYQAHPAIKAPIAV